MGDDELFGDDAVEHILVGPADVRTFHDFLNADLRGKTLAAGDFWKPRDTFESNPDGFSKWMPSVVIGVTEKKIYFLVKDLQQAQEVGVRQYYKCQSFDVSEVVKKSSEAFGPRGNVNRDLSCDWTVGDMVTYGNKDWVVTGLVNEYILVIRELGAEKRVNGVMVTYESKVHLVTGSQDLVTRELGEEKQLNKKYIDNGEVKRLS